ncbi:MAG TPA: FAD-binding oxidoreductase [Polyangia bacterium]|jgi:glycolate oxidase FAD binding subunit|nr:FAD-binding oxidoreductase [Polyangia bacterium]
MTNAGPTLASPTSEATLCETLAAMASAGSAVTCEGSGTKRHHGPTAPASAARVISLRGLDALTAYEPNDLVVTAQAGMRLGDLQRHLAARHQWLPIDPPYAEATLGGILATNSAGPRRLGYGTIKDYILGLRTANAAGVITKSGGRVVKNVTGYDLHRLHIGAFGTLGVLVEVSLKVVPRPDVVAAVVMGFADRGRAHQRLLELATSRLHPAALEVYDGVAAAALRRTRADLPAGEALAIVGVEGTRPVFERHLRDLNLGTLPPSAGALLEGSAVEALWTAVQDLRALLSDAVVLRIGALPQALPVLLEKLALARAGAVGVMAHVGTGIARVILPADDLAATATQLQQPTAIAARAGGYAVVESAPLGLPGRAQLPWRTAGALAGDGQPSLDQRLRQAWDPQRRLNPGRMAS